MSNLQKKLFSLQDTKYKDFQAPLLPSVSKDTMIGVRIPILKKLAKSHLESFDFLKALPHTYFDENNLHALILSELPFDKALPLIEEFLPYIDNWATCDSLRPKCFKKNKEVLLKKIYSWLESSHVYTVRFGIEMLMVHFLGEDFKTEYAETVASIESDEYYVNMMIAWYFATALAKNPEEIMPFFENGKIPPKAFLKAIQKSRESFRITKEQKLKLSALKIQIQAKFN